MSVMYGPGQSPYQGQPGKVNFGWIGESWQIFSQAAGIWIGATVIYAVVYLAIFVPFEFWMQTQWNPAFSTRGGVLGNPYAMNANPLSLYAKMFGSGLFWLFELAIMLFMSFASSSLLRLALKQVRREPVGFADAFSGGNAVGRMFLFYLLSGLFNMLGVVACFVGMFVTYALVLPGLAMVADGDKPMDAFSKSIQGMKNDWIMAGLFMLVFFLLLIASEIPCGLGLFVTMPMFFIIAVLAYRDMAGMQGINSPQYGMPSYGPDIPGTWPPPPGSFVQPPYGQQPYGQPPSPSPYGQPPAPPQAQPPYYGQQPPPSPYGQAPTAPPTQTPPPYGQPRPEPPADPPQPSGGWLSGDDAG